MSLAICMSFFLVFLLSDWALTSFFSCPCEVGPAASESILVIRPLMQLQVCAPMQENLPQAEGVSGVASGLRPV